MIDDSRERRAGLLFTVEDERVFCLLRVPLYVRFCIETIEIHADRWIGWQTQFVIAVAPILDERDIRRRGGRTRARTRKKGACRSFILRKAT